MSRSLLQIQYSILSSPQLYHTVAAQGLHIYFRLLYSIAAPPTTATSPPATAQSGDSIPPAADFVDAVLAELEVAVLVVELVLDTEVGFDVA